MFDGYRRERKIRKALHQIAGQRVVAILKGDVQLIEKSPPYTEAFDVAVRTAHIRGWVEVLHGAMPSGTVGIHGSTGVISEAFKPRTFYRLTEGGWSVIHRTQGWIVATFLVSLAALLAPIVAWPK